MYIAYSVASLLRNHNSSVKPVCKFHLTKLSSQTMESIAHIQGADLQILIVVRKIRLSGVLGSFAVLYIFHDNEDHLQLHTKLHAKKCTSA